MAANVLIVAHLLIVLAMIAVILLQRSEGGGLGMGGSSAGLMTVRGSANVLTRTTAILAAMFFATSVGLTILSEIDPGSRAILDRATSVGEGAGSPTSVLDALNQLQDERVGADPPVGSDLPVPPAPDGAAAPQADQTPSTAPGTAEDPGLAVPVPPAPAP